MTKITGHDLIALGFKPGPIFKQAFAHIAALESLGKTREEIEIALEALRPAPQETLELRYPHSPFGIAITADTMLEFHNVNRVVEHMASLTRLPVVERGAIMPDACPVSRQLGTMPVGTAIVSRAIHPGFHSADICCSMHVSFYPIGPKTGAFMDAMQSATRFGPGGRNPDDWVDDPITDELATTQNQFLRGLQNSAKSQLADQGDGNHFAFLGSLHVTQALLDCLFDAGYDDLAGKLRRHIRVIAMVTHHGSRSLGAKVYKRGMAAAIKHTKVVCPDAPKHQSWLDPDTADGQEYWDALQYVERWTKRNHQLIHESTAALLGIQEVASLGNAHNFVWRRDDLYFHGKGATPAWNDEQGRPLIGLIPMNMAEPVLLTLGQNRHNYCSFSPHGAGRNVSRTQTLREAGLEGLTIPERESASWKIIEQATKGLDIRFYCGKADASEGPDAYKTAATIESQINEFGLAHVIGKITPLGCIMAGDFDKPWLAAREAKKAARS
jgi:hypothetical protein